jgi:hypothetical protein
MGIVLLKMYGSAYIKGLRVVTVSLKRKIDMDDDEANFASSGKKEHHQRQVCIDWRIVSFTCFNFWAIEFAIYTPDLLLSI